MCGPGSLVVIYRIWGDGTGGSVLFAYCGIFILYYVEKNVTG